VSPIIRCALVACLLGVLLGLGASLCAADGDNVGHENGLLRPMLTGDWYDAIVAVYAQVLGPVFHALVFLLGPVLIAVKYQSLAPLGIVMLISGVVFAMFFPADLQFLFAIGAILGLAVMLYMIVHK